jgi:hypothetical protein
MQPTSSAFQAVIQGSHQSVCRVDIIRNGSVVMQLPIVDGSVTADRTAAQMRQFDATLTDPDGTLTPADMSAVLAPFGTRAQLWRGVLIVNIDAVQDVDNSAATFSQGTNNGTIGDPVSGALILGWT